MAEPHDMERSFMEYWAAVREVLPLACLGGVIAVMLHTAEIFATRPWLRALAVLISIFSVGAAAAFCASLALPFLPWAQGAELFVASVAGAMGQKFFDLIVDRYLPIPKAPKGK